MSIPAYPNPRPNICSQTNAAPPLRIASPSHFIAYHSHPSHREDLFRALTPSSPRTSYRPRPGSHSRPPARRTRPSPRGSRKHRRVRAPRAPPASSSSSARPVPRPLRSRAGAARGGGGERGSGTNFGSGASGASPPGAARPCWGRRRGWRWARGS